MGTPLHLLVVEDSDADAELLLRVLRRAGYDLIYKRVDSLASMREALEQVSWDIVLSDHAMPGFNAPAALALCREQSPEMPFIIVSGQIDIGLAVSMIKAGASDFISKQELARLVPTVERELREVQVRRDRAQAEVALQQSRQRLAKILESISDGFIAVDRELRVTYCNQAAERVLGRGRDQVLGKSLREAFPETVGSIFEQRTVAAVRQEREDSFETSFEGPSAGRSCDVKLSPYEGGMAMYFRMAPGGGKIG